MNKNELLKIIIERLQADYSESVNAINETAEIATHEENIAKSKYDTKSIEASYLVEGQLRRNAELEEEITSYQAMRIKTFDQNSRVLLSALIKVEDEDGKIIQFFMGPQAGGMIIDSVQLITPRSPLGQELLGKYVGDEVCVSLDNELKTYKIISLS
ncbi:GreA/GreB family elongation factor [Lentisphaera profundi]|uniref:GreA/GreB family elongation factor n=1 Tax=Lentisphaera profundi TaxID=1658616 RepID=A0ABY7VTQ5_9BACT|nr:GreA/GreB family elongation factor [Lentisphaera profundi]WDE96610.1 GreA/GreB family elongation factor [Lentisphaera profundi]